jgi:hypothetical protein
MVHIEHTGFQRVYAYDMIYVLLTALGLTPGGSRTVHIYTNNTQNNTMEQNTQNIHNNKNITFTKLNRSIQNIQTYIYIHTHTHTHTMIKIGTKRV